MSPFQILTEAQKAVPAVKFALGVAGVAAAFAIIAGFTTSLASAFIGTIIMLGFMFVLLVFSSIARKAASRTTRFYAYTLAGFFVLMIMVTTLLLFMSFFFNYPRPFNQLFTVSSGTSNSSVTSKKPTHSLEEAKSLLQEHQKKWVQRIFAAQSQNGGIRIHPLDPSTRTQAWTTAQCLTGVLSSQIEIERHLPQIKTAFAYIENARRTQPEEGWGLFEEHEKTVTEIMSWVVVANIGSVESGVRIWNDSELQQVMSRIERDIALIVTRQDAGGGWRPITDDHSGFSRTYSTLIALWALVEARRSSSVFQRIGNRYDGNIRNGIMWLLNHYNPDYGWFPNPNRRTQREFFPGLTAHILFVLSRAERDFDFIERHSIYISAERRFSQHTDLVQRSVSYNNRLHDTDVSFPPTTFVLEGSTFLWCPWSLAELTHLSTDNSLSPLKELHPPRSAAIF